MKNNKFIALVAILSQLTGISAKAADTPKVPSDSVKTAESKKSKNPNKQKADTPKISSDSVKTAESEKTKTPSKQKKKKMENRNDVSSEGGYENLYPYGLWGLHEILSLCGGDSWWKYPSYLSVLKNLVRLFSSEEDESMDTQLKKMEQQASELKKQAAELKKQADKQEADEIKKYFGQDASVEDIKGKIKKIQMKIKKKENKRNLKIKILTELDDKLELTAAMYQLAHKIPAEIVISYIISAVNMNNKIINIKKTFNNRYKKDSPYDSYGIYDVVSVDRDVVKDALPKNVKGFANRSLEELNKHIDKLQFFLIFNSSGDCRGSVLVSLVCCRNLSFAEECIKSEAKNVRNPSSWNPFWKMFIGSAASSYIFFECDIDEIKNGDNKSSESD